MDSKDESNTQNIVSKGILHGLPDLSSAPKGLTAVVTGANGISGAHMLKVLASNPSRWKKIYALSRRPPPSSDTWSSTTIEHIPVDFLQSPSEIAGILRDKGVRPDYVFFFSYVLVTDGNGALQWGDERLVEKNNLLLTNFLEALPLASALPKRFFIQLGGKWYGVHLGATNTPDTETDPQLTLEPNLYYTQHALLTQFCARHNIAWNASLPSFIIGCTPSSTQTLVYPLFIYACVQKFRGMRLEWPSDLRAWYAPQSLSNAMLNGHLAEWAALAPGTANQAFNATDDCAFTWARLWPQLAEHFDMPYTGPETGDEGWREKGMKASPPPHGWGNRSVMRFRWSFVEWAQEAENVAAWKELVRRYGLKGEEEWSDVGSVFGRADFALHRPYPSLLSATKAKKFGFFGFVDSCESILSTVDDFAAAKMIPPPRDIVPKGS